MTTAFEATSPQMERVIQQLAAEYGVDLSQQGAQLSLAISTRPDRWLIANLDGTRISVTHCVVEEGDCLAPDLDMVFALTPHGWEPLELLYADEVWDTYIRAAHTAGTAVYDEAGDTLFAHFTEYWAEQIQAQGWLTHSCRLPDAFWPLPDDKRAVLGTASGRRRMAGCQSTNHDRCYGELWQCAACGKTVCYAEGTDDHPEVCDDCWVKHQTTQAALNEEADDVPF